ncbi:killer cell lectin-like receptor subfamily B member 1B allele B [Heteronotia binoei]|uniref:killer cell lectin-like receptor subfamily B member 1B allele B n=1 Tax=Heteronotia binoei TaxID=13085 RepID=UPI00292E9723|nr:killer cell lectin-like receptor subfamily B member 1B allele B [Heteronotia binoei]
MVDKVVYADLNLPKAGLVQPSQACCSHQCPRWHHVALRVGGAGCIALLMAVVVLSVSVIQSPKAKAETSPEMEVTPQRSRNRSNCNSSLDRLMPYLKQHVCEPEQRTSAENPIYHSREKQCFLCPKDWLFHDSKCYRFFDEIQKDWNKSNENCSEKHAQLLVIQDQEEQAFIKNIVKNKNAFWIGLQFNSCNKEWFWVDDSPLQRNINSFV